MLPAGPGPGVGQRLRVGNPLRARGRTPRLPRGPRTSRRRLPPVSRLSSTARSSSPKSPGSTATGAEVGRRVQPADLGIVVVDGQLGLELVDQVECPAGQVDRARAPARPAGSRRTSPSPAGGPGAGPSRHATSGRRPTRGESAEADISAPSRRSRNRSRRLTPVRGGLTRGLDESGGRATGQTSIARETSAGRASRSRGRH